MNKIKASVIMITIWLVLGLYTAFVAMCYFNWFVTRILNVNNASYLEMLGIVWLFGLFKDRTKSVEHNSKIDYEKHPTIFWEQVFIGVFELIANNTLIFAIGYGLHLLIK
ncbi:MAG: hypothetical protein H6Q18_925 [Bacteroidetes bacterium]|nr:hypothetical protein [Bacteroidota bacterium]